jgi:hypothetical protein
VQTRTGKLLACVCAEGDCGTITIDHSIIACDGCDCGCPCSCGLWRGKLIGVRLGVSATRVQVAVGDGTEMVLAYSAEQVNNLSRISVFSTIIKVNGHALPVLGRFTGMSMSIDA